MKVADLSVIQYRLDHFSVRIYPKDVSYGRHYEVDVKFYPENEEGPDQFYVGPYAIELHFFGKGAGVIKRRVPPHQKNFMDLALTAKAIVRKYMFEREHAGTLECSRWTAERLEKIAVRLGNGSFDAADAVQSIRDSLISFKLPRRWSASMLADYADLDFPHDARDQRKPQPAPVADEVHLEGVA